MFSISLLGKQTEQGSWNTAGHAFVRPSYNDIAECTGGCFDIGVWDQKILNQKLNQSNPPKSGFFYGKILKITVYIGIEKRYNNTIKLNKLISLYDNVL